MTIAAVISELFFGIRAIVDHKLGIGDEIENIGIELARLMLGVGDVGNGAAAMLHAIPDSTPRMLQRTRFDEHIIAKLDLFACLEISIVDIAAEDLRTYRQERCPHQILD